ncbi:MAG: homoserine dehydrogenase [Acidobacteriota bacterium]
MSLEVLSEVEPGAREAVQRQRAEAAAPDRIVRIGLLGLGQVGQAVARLVARTGRDTLGHRFRIEAALVRHVDQPRRCTRPPRLTSNPSAFLRGRYDLVIEALGTVEPARTLVARLLGRGVPVVTANKALVAAHGPELARLAARTGASFRYEATALAGVPFLGALAARPLLASLDGFTAVVNGTSNFILSTLAAEGGALDPALARAQQLGLAEPDPSRDLDGEDAADKLQLLAALAGWGRLARPGLEVQGIRGIDGADLAAARALGGTLKPVAAARLLPDGALEAFVGPVFVAREHPLASLAGTLNGIQLHGRYVRDLFFSGPGAGPDVTAATLVDDGVEAVSSLRRVHRAAVARGAAPRAAASPATPWFVRLSFPGIVPAAADVASRLADAGLPADLVSAGAEPSGRTRWALTPLASKAHVDAALARLRHAHRVDAVAFRRIP